MLSNDPQLDDGGCTPNPRKLKVDSMMIAVATVSDMLTAMIPARFGRIWRTTTRGVDAPMERAASTNSFSRRLSTWARAILATYVHPIAASTKTIAGVDRPSDSSASARIAIAGTMRNRSVNRITSSSMIPPAYPAMVPTKVPNAVDNTATARPTDSETRPAYSSSLR